VQSRQNGCERQHGKTTMSVKVTSEKQTPQVSNEEVSNEVDEPLSEAWRPNWAMFDSLEPADVDNCLIRDDDRPVSGREDWLWHVCWFSS